MERSELLNRIKSRMPEKRYIHTIGVMETAIQLAELYGADVKAARNRLPFCMMLRNMRMKIG